MLGAAPAWVTVNVAEAVPARKVRTPIRVEVEGFSATVATGQDPVAPLVGETVNHVAFDSEVQNAWFVVTGTVADCACCDGLHDPGLTEILGSAPAWVTVHSFTGPEAATEIVPTRGTVEGLAATVTLIVPPETPVAGETANHVAFEYAYHAD